MRAITDICYSCQAYGPIAVVATLGNSRRVALCRVCAGEPGNLHALVAQLDRPVVSEPALPSLAPPPAA